jgi:putative PIN family toxin of toxin-antitoxin system
VAEVLNRPKITKKYRITRADRDAFLRLLQQDAIPLPHQVAPRVCRDPDDDYLLGCAAGAAVDYLVTGDADLLTLRRYQTVVILTARDFLTVLSP